MADEVKVDVETLPPAEQYVVDEWLRGGATPEFSPADGGVTNGRNRTWFSRRAGAAEVPVINTPVGDAVWFWSADPEMYGTPDHESLADWHRERRWWDGATAAAWAQINSRHLSLWDAGLQRWKRRLGPRSTGEQ